MSVTTFRSSLLGPQERGEEFGRVFADRIAETVDGYHELFSLSLGAEADLADWGARAVTAIGSFSPAALAEIEGIARGSQQPVTHLAAINARTEILAACNRRRAARADEGADSTMAPRAGECSTLVHVDDRSDPIAVQVWDWYDNLADSWLVWEIPTASGLVTTVTEFGILGKIGVNTDGIGVLFNILHHAEDGHEVGVPVHVLARTILDTCTDLNQALLLAAGARVSASTSLTVVATAERERTDALGQAMSTEGRVRPPHLDTEAVSIEVNPERIGYHLPDAQGVLVHTNHFLGAEAGEADEELLAGPDTVVRYAGIHRRAHRRLEAKGALTVRDAIAAMDSHVLGGGGSCCHPDAGRPDTPQFASLATISLDIAAGTLTAHAGGPCTHPLLAG